MIDIARIENEEEKTLIVDAINLCEQGFYRASYIMAWLSCVESLKRRFFEAGKRASEIGKSYREIIELEKQHKSVDKKIIEDSFKHNFISDSEKSKLEHFFEMRSVYSHPYEEAPSKIDCEHIIENIIDIILSKPVLLNEGGIKAILKRLTEEESFLEDDEGEVIQYVNDIKPMINPKKYIYFVESYLQVLENETLDQNNSIIHRRSFWFLKEFLVKTKIINNIKENELEDLIYKYRISSSFLLSSIEIYKSLTKSIKAKVFFLLLNSFKEIHSRKFVIFIEDLQRQDLLNKQQIEMYSKILRELDWTKLRLYKITIEKIYDKVLQALKARDYYIQNPACEYLLEHDTLHFNKLTVIQQNVLGRNLVQCADGGVWGANDFLIKISNLTYFPENIIVGIVYEMFLDDNYKFRFKIDCIEVVSNIVEKHFDPDKKEKLLKGLKEKISKSELKRPYLNDTEIKKMEANPFFSQLIAGICKKHKPYKVEE